MPGAGQFSIASGGAHAMKRSFAMNTAYFPAHPNLAIRASQRA